MKIYIFTDYMNGQKVEDIITKKGAGFISTTYIDGEKITENKIYKVNTDKPYCRAFGEKFYFTGERLQALKELAAG